MELHILTFYNEDEQSEIGGIFSSRQKLQDFLAECHEDHIDGGFSTFVFYLDQPDDYYRGELEVRIDDEGADYSFTDHGEC